MKTARTVLLGGMLVATITDRLAATPVVTIDSPTNSQIVVTLQGFSGTAQTNGAALQSVTFAGDTFAGRLDEIAVYNRALSGTEIAGIFVAGPTGKCAPSPASLAFDNHGGLLWTPGGFRFDLTNLSGHGPVVIYASTNFTTWEPIFTNPAANGFLRYLDTESTNLPRRFYRAKDQ